MPHKSGLELKAQKENYSNNGKTKKKKLSQREQEICSNKYVDI